MKRTNLNRKVSKASLRVIICGILYLVFAGFLGLAMLYLLRERLVGAEKFFSYGLYTLILLVISVFVMGFYDKKKK